MVVLRRGDTVRSYGFNKAIISKVQVAVAIVSG